MLVTGGCVGAVVYETLIAESPRWPLLFLAMTLLGLVLVAVNRPSRPPAKKRVVELDFDAHAELLEVDPVYAEIDAARRRALRRPMQPPPARSQRPSDAEHIETMLLAAERNAGRLVTGVFDVDPPTRNS